MLKPTLLALGLATTFSVLAQDATPVHPGARLDLTPPTVREGASFPSLEASIEAKKHVVPLLTKVSTSTTPEKTEMIRLEFEGETPTVDLQQGNRQVVLDLGQTQIAGFAHWSSSLPRGVKVLPGVGASSSKITIDLAKEVNVKAFQAGRFFVLELMPKVAAPTATTSAAVSQAQTKASQKRYTGKSVTFNFQDVPVRTVLQLLADESGNNIVAADSVSGNVTLRLIGVPWDQALDVLMQSKGLDQRRDGRLIWVAPQEELAKFEQSREDARIELENRAEMKTEYLRINYHSAAAIFKGLTEAKGIGGSKDGDKAQDNSFLSPRGRIVVDERTNTLIISDIPKKITQMRELIQEIDRPIDQVLIEARLVIANENFARDLGSRFGVTGRRIGNNVAVIGSSIENNNDATRGLNSNLGAGGFVNNSPASLAYMLLGANFSLDMELSAMQEEGKGEVISNPRLITSNQREAVIRQGKEVGYVTITGSGSGGAATPSVQFKEALLELKVTPTITNDNRVFLNLNVKKDEVERFLDLGDYGAVPQLNKREINTAVLMENGQTVVVGGVYEFTDRESLAKVPFLGDVPFLGNLFKKKGRSKEKAELLVFITPKTMLVRKEGDPVVDATQSESSGLIQN